MKTALKLEFTRLVKRLRMAFYQARVTSLAAQMMPHLNHHIIREQIDAYENEIFGCFVDRVPAPMVAMVIAEDQRRHRPGPYMGVRSTYS